MVILINPGSCLGSSNWIIPEASLRQIVYKKSFQSAQKFLACCGDVSHVHQNGFDEHEKLLVTRSAINVEYQPRLTKHLEAVQQVLVDVNCDTPPRNNSFGTIFWKLSSQIEYRILLTVCRKRVIHL